MLNEGNWLHDVVQWWPGFAAGGVPLAIWHGAQWWINQREEKRKEDLARTRQLMLDENNAEHEKSREIEASARNLRTDLLAELERRKDDIERLENEKRDLWKLLDMAEVRARHAEQNLDKIRSARRLTEDSSGEII